MNYIFGSWFDPVTKAHEAILKKLQKDIMHSNDKLFICITENDEKLNHTPVEARCKMMNELIESKKIDATLLVQTQRMYDFLQQDCFANFKKEDVTIVIGQDEFEALSANKWKYSAVLKKNYKFVVFFRTADKNCTQTNCMNAKFYSIDEALNTVSSSAVRKIFYKNPVCHYKDVQNYISRPIFKCIKTNKLYYQNALDYADVEKQFIEEYKSRGWGQFANTVDILAYNANKVLLIRRKKPPFQGYFALPGGFFDAVDMTDKETGAIIKADIDLEHAAQRELHEETNLNLPVEKFKQIKTYSHNFDPRLRIVDTAFAVRVPAKYVKTVQGLDDAYDAQWFNIDDLPALAFHHAMIINDFNNMQNKDN